MTENAVLADKLRSGKPVITGWSMLAAPVIAELMARSGYEAVTLDLQHGMHDFQSACDGFSALALGGAHRIARIPVGDNALASRLADVGAECLIAPMINSRKDAEAFVGAVKYPPVGERSWAPYRAIALNKQTTDEYLTTANTRTLAFAMIETREAVENLAEILSVPGLDGVFVGPSDLSLALSNGAKLDPNGDETARVCGGIAAKTRAAGKIAGIFCLGAAKVEEAVGQGYRLMSHGTDITLFDHAARLALREVSPISQRPSGPAAGY
ncbi:HpcH/HpaI aldolase family protein [Roseibium sp.]|uniref:HpcH/HpaI aldolase family protein n=1 Tax=Roseibium sp. TaxID=1936156 RepID=UPI003B525922